MQGKILPLDFSRIHAPYYRYRVEPLTKLGVSTGTPAIEINKTQTFIDGGASMVTILTFNQNEFGANDVQATLYGSSFTFTHTFGSNVSDTISEFITAFETWLSTRPDYESEMTIISWGGGIALRITETPNITGSKIDFTDWNVSVINPSSFAGASDIECEHYFRTDFHLLGVTGHNFNVDPVTSLDLQYPSRLVNLDGSFITKQVLSSSVALDNLNLPFNAIDITDLMIKSGKYKIQLGYTYGDFPNHQFYVHYIDKNQNSIHQNVGK